MANVIIEYIGTTTSGKKIVLPGLINERDGMLWLVGYNLREQTDLFCMAELILLNFGKKNAGEISKNLQIVFDILNQRFARNIFTDILSDLMLTTSLDRIRYAKGLLTAAYV